MKICFVFHSNRRVGANLSLLRHATFLRSQGHHVSVVFEHRALPRTLDFITGAETIHTWYLDEYPHDAGLQDVVVTNWWQCAYELHRIPARLYCFCHHTNTKALAHLRIFDALTDAVFREDFLCFCVSDFLAEEVRGVGGQPIILPNGVDVARFSTATPMLPPKSGSLRVLVEGMVPVAFKRVDATVDAIRGIEGVEIVHMAADGSCPAGPVDYALGAIDHDATAGVYASCDLIVKLSGMESFAMPVLEQFAAGGTAVVTDFRGRDQYIDESNAIIVDIERPFEPAAASVRMLRDNPRRLALLKAGASATARRFDWAALYQKFARTLESAVHDRPQTQQRLPLMERYRPCWKETFALWAAEQVRRQQPLPPPEPSRTERPSTADGQTGRQ